MVTYGDVEMSVRRSSEVRDYLHFSYERPRLDQVDRFPVPLIEGRLRYTKTQTAEAARDKWDATLNLNGCEYGASVVIADPSISWHDPQSFDALNHVLFDAMRQRIADTKAGRWLTFNVPGPLIIATNGHMRDVGIYRWTSMINFNSVAHASPAYNAMPVFNGTPSTPFGRVQEKGIYD